MALRTHRLGVEVLADTPTRVSLHRQSLEAAVESDAANASASIFASRLALEVLADTPSKVLLHRQSFEVAVDSDAANASASIFASRLALEVLADTADAVSLHRQSIEAAIDADFANTAARIFASRLALEVLASAPPTVSALALPDDLEVFLHNWKSTVEIETSWPTDVQMAHTVAEKRRGMSSKPYRTAIVTWFATNREEADAMLRQMRAMTAEQWAVPLDSDQARITAAVTTASDTIFCDTTERRFYAGGHVALVEVGRSGHRTGTAHLRKIATRYSDRLVLTETVESLPLGQWLVVPVLNTEIIFAPECRFQSGRLVEAQFTFLEVFGKSSLPPSDTGLPSGFPTLDGIPVWDIEPNYGETVQGGYVREGELHEAGLGRIAEPLGDRARATGLGNLLLERADWWRALRFFDSRRGRLLPFFRIEQEDLIEVASFDASGTFVNVVVDGELADFEAELSYLGVVLRDGTHLVREVVSVQAVFGVWRVTLSTPLTTGLLASQVRRVARARLVRNAEDAMKEGWVTTNVVRSAISTIELLREGEVEL